MTTQFPIKNMFASNATTVYESWNFVCQFQILAYSRRAESGVDMNISSPYKSEFVHFEVTIFHWISLNIEVLKQ